MGNPNHDELGRFAEGSGGGGGGKAMSASALKKAHSAKLKIVADNYRLAGYDDDVAIKSARHEAQYAKRKGLPFDPKPATGAEREDLLRNADNRKRYTADYHESRKSHAKRKKISLTAAYAELDASADRAAGPGGKPFKAKTESEVKVLDRQHNEWMKSRKKR